MLVMDLTILHLRMVRCANFMFGSFCTSILLLSLFLSYLFIDTRNLTIVCLSVRMTSVHGALARKYYIQGLIFKTDLF